MNRRHGKLQDYIEKPAGISVQPLRTTASPRFHTAWLAQKWSAGARLIGKIRIWQVTGHGVRSEPLLQRWRLKNLHLLGGVYLRLGLWQLWQNVPRSRGLLSAGANAQTLLRRP